MEMFSISTLSISSSNFDFVSLFRKMLSLGKTGERGQRISLYFFIQLAACESIIL